MLDIKELKSVSDYETSIDLIPDVASSQNGSGFSETYHRHTTSHDGTLPHRVPSQSLSGADSQDAHKQREENRICCFVRIDRFPPAAKFFICSFGIFFCFMIYGYVQELMFRIEGFKDFGWYLTLMQFTFYTVFSYCERRLTMKDIRRRIPLRYYAIIGFLAMATIGLSNVSLAYLNYPTQVVFKCCKLIPVLIGGILIQGKRYGILDGMAACCMSIGLIFFVLADNKVQPNFDVTGVILVSLALIADAAIGNIQEKAVRIYHGSTLEVVYFTHLIGGLYILVGLLLSGELFQAFSYCWEHPKFYAYATLFGITGYVGVQMVLTMVISFGAFIAMSVTTFRKALSIVVSFIAFTKPFTLQYLWAGFIILFGIYLNVYSRNQQEMKSYSANIISRIRYLFCFLAPRRRHPTREYSQVV
ncbi:adenosine 3'-phospho 5'-phosphosulfate transporter 2-like [Paramacrobiotus metropolitanus]|uniref:adenosine 3'-phospho 5'-phosphosulfate transporter 2-like n=1 Tax=Paramacrobiotus metropolitanus TaxID=2943436 RepID=UPI002445E9E1|nr:adenosine 3'-phospho 5'-phosphosulfate transporter 2-like [Paramacrobiotus metropolitanus]